MAAHHALFIATLRVRVTWRNRNRRSTCSLPRPQHTHTHTCLPDLTHTHTHPQGHGDAINGIAWSPDGKLIATACDDMLLRLYDLHDLTATTTRDSGSGGGGSSSQPRDIKFKSHELRATPLGVGFGNDGHSLVVATRGAC
jgi:WD40 repeat protein